MSMDIVIALALLDAVTRDFGVARLLLVVIAGIVLKAGNEGTRDKATEAKTRPDRLRTDVRGVHR